MTITLVKTVLPSVFKIIVRPKLDLSVPDGLHANEFADLYCDLRDRITPIAEALKSKRSTLEDTSWYASDGFSDGTDGIFRWHVDSGGRGNGSLRAAFGIKGQKGTSYRENRTILETAIGGIYLVKHRIHHKAPSNVLRNQRIVFRISGTYEAFRS